MVLLEALASLLACLLPNVNPAYLAEAHPAAIPYALPVLVIALLFRNVVSTGSGARPAPPVRSPPQYPLLFIYLFLAAIAVGQRR